MGIPSNPEQKLEMAEDTAKATAWTSVVALEDSPIPSGWGQEAGRVTGSGLYIAPPPLKKTLYKKTTSCGACTPSLRHQLGTKINTCWMNGLYYCVLVLATGLVGEVVPWWPS